MRQLEKARKGTVKMRSIYVVGSLNMDMTVTAQRMPAMGETITGSGFSTAHGGKGANQAVAAARLGGRVKMCGCVGEDGFGEALTASLAREGIDTDFVEKIAGISTGVAVITVVNGDNSIVVSKGANARVTAAQVRGFLDSAQSGDILLVQLETDFEAVREALSLAADKEMLRVVNPAPSVLNAAELCSLADIMIPNETELFAMTETQDIGAGLEKIASLGARTAIATLGSKGCAYFEGGAVAYKSCPPAKAVDTTGAGDTFCGALCAELSRGAALEAAIDFALRAATLSVTRAGAQPSIPRLDELK